VYSGIIPNIR